jgi:glycosyltransferase involved in cell wall biosynthesis
VLIGTGPASRKTRFVAPASLPARLAGVCRAVKALAAQSDLVDAHFALYAAVPLLTGALGGRPFVVHFHGPWADESAAVGQPGAAVRVKRQLERTVYQRADRMIVLSHAFKRLLVEGYGIPPWTIEVIRPSVDLNRFQPPSEGEDPRATLGLPAEEPVAVTVRRLVPRMGLDTLLRAWSHVEQGTLLVVGDGPERARLESQTRDLGLAERVRFTGQVSEEQLLACYQAADVCVLPSLALEGFGLVVLEALASGTPVVASDAGGLPEALAGLSPGLVTPRGDERALTSTLVTALGDPTSLPSPERCRAHAERFSPQALAEHHDALYRGVMDPAPPRRRVVYVDHCARLSGGELALLNIIAATDVDAHVILGEDGPLVRRLHDAGISVEVLPLPESARELRKEQVDVGRLGMLGPLRTALYIPRLALRLRALQPDLVHTNTLKSGLYGSVAARLARIPVIWHLHDRLADDYLPQRAVSLMRRAVRVLPNALLANSEASLATVPRPPRGGAGVIANPVAALPQAPIRDQVTRVGMIGRLAPWKGQPIFIEAFARAFPEGDVTATIVGAALFGEDDYAADLRVLAESLGIANRVEFLGFRPDVTAELERLDVLVHASVVPEPFGQVIVEAMAAGVPTVTAAGGGASEIATDGDSTLMHPPGDVEALAQALRRLAADRSLRERLADGGRRRALDFAPDVIAERLRRTYDAVLEGEPLPVIGRDAEG